MSDFRWPSRADVLTVQDISIARFGGAGGIRDTGLLDSALARPFASFGGFEAFPNDITKACALCHAIIANHPFIDGNKRTGAAALGMILRSNKVAFKPTHAEFYKTVMGVATGTISLESLTKWVSAQTQHNSKQCDKPVRA